MVDRDSAEGPCVETVRRGLEMSSVFVVCRPRIQALRSSCPCEKCHEMRCIRHVTSRYDTESLKQVEEVQHYVGHRIMDTGYTDTCDWMTNQVIRSVNVVNQ